MVLVTELVQASVIVYVRVTVQPQSFPVTSSDDSTVTSPPQLSVYNALTASLLNNSVISLFAKQLFCSVISDGHSPDNAGAVWSLPLTLMVLVTELVQASVIVYVRVIFQLQSLLLTTSSLVDTVISRLQEELYIAFTWSAVKSCALCSSE